MCVNRYIKKFEMKENRKRKEIINDVGQYVYLYCIIQVYTAFMRTF